MFFHVFGVIVGYVVMKGLEELLSTVIELKAVLEGASKSPLLFMSDLEVLYGVFNSLFLLLLFGKVGVGFLVFLMLMLGVGVYSSSFVSFKYDVSSVWVMVCGFVVGVLWVGSVSLLVFVTESWFYAYFSM